MVYVYVSSLCSRLHKSTARYKKVTVAIPFASNCFPRTEKQNAAKKGRECKKEKPNVNGTV